ncbi:MAG TPA: hypothetical protein VIY51_15760 [Xanthobacteraceae bacterium]
MADFTGSLTDILNFVAAAGGLGTAAMGLVDASKAFRGGPSNIGFGSIESALSPFLAPLGAKSAAFGKAEVLQTLKANWLNGVPKADQKAKAKSLIHLGLSKGNAARLAAAAGVDPKKLASLAQKTATGDQPTQDEVNVLGQFDAVLSAVLDTAYERGDQQYRNAAKCLAMLVATILGVVGGWIVLGNGPTPSFTIHDFALSLLVGLSATPLAPIAKDLTSSLQAAVSAARALKR